MIGSNGWFKDCFYAGEMKTLAVYLEKYLEELDFSMIFNEKVVSCNMLLQMKAR